MTQEHPITPSSELVEKWYEAIDNSSTSWKQELTTQAARWGADQELEACINYFHEYDTSWGEDSDLIAGLRAIRRPKPPSLKEQALEQLDSLHSDLKLHGLGTNTDTIRRALECLPD
jgi:hypothetical protein